MDYVTTMREQIGSQGLMLPAANIIFIKGEKLVMQKRKNGKIGFVGGFVEYGESIIEGLKREVYEETKLNIDESKLVLHGMYSKHVMKYPNGDEVQPFSVFFTYVLASDERLIAVPPESDEMVEVELGADINILNAQHRDVFDNLSLNFNRVVID